MERKGGPGVNIRMLLQAPPAPGDAGMGGLQEQQTGHRKDQIIHLQL